MSRVLLSILLPRFRVCGGWPWGLEDRPSDGHYQESGQTMDVQPGTQGPPLPEERLCPMVGQRQRTGMDRKQENHCGLDEWVFETGIAGTLRWKQQMWCLQRGLHCLFHVQSQSTGPERHCRTLGGWCHYCCWLPVVDTSRLTATPWDRLSSPIGGEKTNPGHKHIFRRRDCGIHWHVMICLSL